MSCQCCAPEKKGHADQEIAADHEYCGDDRPKNTHGEGENHAEPRGAQH